MAMLLPPTPAPADYQLGGAYRPAAQVRIVVRDRTAEPAPGRYNICYLNAFQTQPGELGWWRRRHPDLLTGIRDPGWPGEVLLDTSTATKRRAIVRINARWMKGCAHEGFDAVEPDNLDSWTRSRGRLRRGGNAALARGLIRSAHRLGLAIAQKNAVALRRLPFDFAVVEDCRRYRECGHFLRRYGNRVIDVEYRRRDFHAACAAHATAMSIVFRDRGLRPRGAPGYRFLTCPASR